jgi:hypothetical protein
MLRNDSHECVAPPALRPQNGQILEIMDSPERLLFTERTFLILSVLLAAYQAWIYRQSMMSDGISYLDIGDAYLRGDWKAAINAYWGPLYSLILGSAIWVFKPSLRWEFPVVHLVNFVIFCAALFSFHSFLRAAMTKSRHQGSEIYESEVSLPAWITVAMSYMVVLWSLLVLDDLILVTPDLLLAALVFLLGRLLVDLHTQHSIWKFLAFGSICGVAYLTKSIMFPLAFVFLAVLFFSGTISKARVRGILLAAVAFLLVASPFIFALSKSKGRLTYGDAGRLAYAALVSPQSPQTNWQGNPAGSGIPVHPTRQLLDDPPVFEYAQPVGGTYPPWYDPSYWNEGVRPTFRLRSQVRVLVQSLLTYGTIFTGYAPVVTAIVFFLLMGKNSALKAIAHNWPLLIIPLAAAGVYALVLVKSRYVAGFAALFLVAVITQIRVPKDRSRTVPVCLGLAVTFSMLLLLGSHFGNITYRALTIGPEPLMGEQVDVVEGLQGMGLRANDKVAVLGDGLTAYWAHLGRFKIVAEISDPSGRAFWAAAPELKERTYKSIRHTNAEAIITWSPPEIVVAQSWRQIAGTHYYAYVFPK